MLSKSLLHQKRFGIDCSCVLGIFFEWYEYIDVRACLEIVTAAGGVRDGECVSNLTSH